MTIKYPVGTVRDLLTTDLVTEATRQALVKRLNTPPRQPTFFSTDEFTLLQAVCDRLVPQGETDQPIPVADGIDERLSGSETNGWRYDTMPTDGDAYKLGLKGIDESAQALFQQPFLSLTGGEQDQVLKAIQLMEAPGETWQTLPADRFFEELLAEAVENYYSHPIAQEEIGYVGMADTPTWKRVGLDQLEDREPRAVQINE
ncbi:gluconate 2-dehydrogenase subunit 3 family protein [Spirosoma agri]|uniref:Gluconate 2-dehydrogenase subunit 3 family protein n=1 Tax=Spirosoma agri TaxID=1987381 RepID=A0A6M0IDT9_9BACT|nr:gluconate 2-dehydrogenase subunit 3 family protein [Spirosoma agri]NEU65303.1 gluconate 2-dehydrogenase subunit 3 family protein [Spirosoma agri]